MKNYIQEGGRLEYSNTSGSTITSGAAVLVGKRLGVAVSDIANNTAGILAMKGVFNLPKDNTVVVSQGADLYWDNTNKKLTTTVTGNTLAGYAHKAAGTTTTVIDCMINR